MPRPNLSGGKRSGLRDGGFTRWRDAVAGHSLPRRRSGALGSRTLARAPGGAVDLTLCDSWGKRRAR